MEDSMKQFIKKRRSLEAEARIFHSCYDNNLQLANTTKVNHISSLERQIALIDSWLLLLNEDEAYVIKRHLIDGIDWPRIAVEYKGIWGEDYAKSERTLKTYQQRAMSKIVRFTQEQNAYPQFI